MSGTRGDEWLLFLGAGASAPPPTSLPTFPALSAAILESIGWRQAAPHCWEHRSYPSFTQPEMPSEVLFGVLNRFGVKFTEELASALHATHPNAIHEVAARVLAAGGIVWTTNVDGAVELASRPQHPPRAGTASAAGSVLGPLTAASGGTLVKFHGTVEQPSTLAFTERELLAPLADDAVAHLTELACDRRMILYGYAGADADLFGLLELSFAAAREVIWFEPSQDQRRRIERSFPSSQLYFRPVVPPVDQAQARLATAESFLALAVAASVGADAGTTQALSSTPKGAPLRLPPKRPSGITQARIVERFGNPGDDRRALAQARWEDALHLRVGTLRGHLRWTVRNSLYGDGVVGKALQWLTIHRRILWAVRPVRLREYLITRGSALRLASRDWRALDEFAGWAIQQRNNPGDHYYRAQSGRYAMRISAARKDADYAQAGLSAVRDPERHAGAVLEQGCLAVYEGRFDEALRAAFELRRRTGRYAIARWQSWGAWLEGVTLCHLQRPAAARGAFDAGIGRFLAEERPGPVADMRSGRLLAARVELAENKRPIIDLDLQEAELLGGRYTDDRSLIAADIKLATGEPAEARALLTAVAAHPSNPIAQAWSSLGLAELARLEGSGSAPDAFQAVAEHAVRRGAYWLALQAAIGLRACGDAGADRIAADLPRYLGSRVGDPDAAADRRILWMTIL